MITIHYFFRKTKAMDHILCAIDRMRIKSISEFDLNPCLVICVLFGIPSGFSAPARSRDDFALQIALSEEKGYATPNERTAL
jgi:hypothetical protein